MTKLSDKKVAAIKADLSARDHPAEDRQEIQGQPLDRLATSPPAASTRTCPGPRRGTPVPSKPAVSGSRRPTTIRRQPQVLELESEIVHLTDERNRERQKVKAGAKIAGLFKAIVSEMEQRIKPFAALPPALDFRRKARDHASIA